MGPRWEKSDIVVSLEKENIYNFFLKRGEVQEEGILPSFFIFGGISVKLEGIWLKCVTRPGRGGSAGA